MGQAVHPYSDVIAAHPASQRPFGGFSLTVGELALYLIEKALTDLKTMATYRGRPDSELIDHQGLSIFPQRLVEMTTAGVRIPVIGPAMVLRDEHNGHFTMNGSFYLSGVLPGIHSEEPGPETGMKTIEQIKASLTRSLDRLRALPGYHQLPDVDAIRLRARLTAGSRPQFDISFADPQGEDQPTGAVVKPHSGLHTVYIAADHIAAAVAMVYCRQAELAEQLSQVSAMFHSVTKGNLELKSIRLKKVGAVLAGTPSFDALSLALDYTYINDHLEQVQRTHSVYKQIGDHQMRGLFEPLAKQAKRQAARAARNYVVIDQVAARWVARKFSIDEVRECFDVRNMFVAGATTYEIRDGCISMTGPLGSDGKVSYDHGTLRLRGLTIPDSIVSSLKGAPVERLIEHPCLAGSTIRYARKLKDEVAVYLDVPKLSIEEFDELVARHDSETRYREEKGK